MDPSLIQELAQSLVLPEPKSDFTAEYFSQMCVGTFFTNNKLSNKEEKLFLSEWARQCVRVIEEGRGETLPHLYILRNILKQCFLVSSRDSYDGELSDLNEKMSKVCSSCAWHSIDYATSLRELFWVNLKKNHSKLIEFVSDEQDNGIETFRALGIPTEQITDEALFGERVHELLGGEHLTEFCSQEQSVYSKEVEELADFSFELFF